MKISYYELLGMIKEGDIPERIEVKIPYVSYSKTYTAIYDGDKFSHYFLLNVEDEDENYKYYLSDCFVESTMFEKCIEIPNDDFEDIEEIRFIIGIEENDETFANKINQLINNQKKIIQILKNKE